MIADSDLLAASSPPAGTTTVLTNEMINTINADVHATQNAPNAAPSTHQQIAARLPPSQINPGQKVLDTQTKLIHHAIHIAAFNASQALARAIITNTGYTRAHDEAHSLIRTALAASGDIIPDPNNHTLHIRPDPLPAPDTPPPSTSSAVSSTTPTPPTPPPTSRCATASNPTNHHAPIPEPCPDILRR